MNIQAKLFAATVCFALSAQANAGPERGARTGSFSRSAQRAELSQKQTVDGATRMAVHNGARVTGTVASRGPGISVSVGKKAPYAPGAIVAAGGHFAASGPLNRSVVKSLSPTKGSVIGSRNSDLNTPNSPFANISAGRRWQTNPSEHIYAVVESDGKRHGPLTIAGARQRHVQLGLDLITDSIDSLHVAAPAPPIPGAFGLKRPPQFLSPADLSIPFLVLLHPFMTGS